MLAAVTIVGGMFGIMGMMLSVPVASTAYTLLKNELNKDRIKVVAEPEIISDNETENE